MKVKRNPTRPRLTVTADAKSVVGHAGARLLSDLSDEVGLTEGLSASMGPTKRRRRGHDRGQVLVDLAVMVAGDGEAISDLATLRDQPALFGPVASTPTAWRALEAVDDDAQGRIATARAAARAVVLEPALPGRRMAARASPVASRKHTSGWNPNPRL